MAEFEIDGNQYRTTRRLSAFDQLHVARKLAPLMAKLAPTAQKAAEQPESELGFFSLMEPVIDGLASMSEEDVNFVTQKCLSVTQRQQGQQWAQVSVDQGRRLMFEDIDAMGLLQIAFNVIQENLGNFMRAPSSTSQSPSQTASASPESSSIFPMAKTGF